MKFLVPKMDQAAELSKAQAEEKKQAKTKPAQEKSILDNPLVRSAGRTAATMITRSLLGVLGLGGRRKKSLF